MPRELSGNSVLACYYARSSISLSSRATLFDIKYGPGESSPFYVFDYLCIHYLSPPIRSADLEHLNHTDKHDFGGAEDHDAQRVGAGQG